MTSSPALPSTATDRRPLILDGGMGRELHRMGAPFRQPEWSALSLMERPDLVQQAHENFLKTGAQIITTNSYAVVPFHIGDERFAKKGEDLARLSGVLGRQAIAAHARPGQTEPLLAGSLPPSCGSYRPDLFTSEKAEAILTPLIRGLAPSVDLWLAETQSSIAELQTAHRLVRQHTSDTRPFWGAFTLDDADPVALVHQKSPVRLRSGDLLEDAVKAALELKLDALLFNCSDPRIMAAALHTARQTITTHEGNTPLRLGIYANGFAHNHHDGEGDGANESITPLDGTLTPDRYSDFAQHWHEEGADIIGGCCGIGPEHIAALAARFPSHH
ncbi:homocysteine S-methyltransferase family protein [Bombella sp. TMW 2.2543]|uniref:Homocysteine S-methyltransferase family protein n=1 Tax=Bombella pluederhausensis TaxID=2967336 RepID=A0ABT3WHG7_9PROT|nr:homocysteine S-methyltransferase family protein [Bombella pluederhausensis]MCX5617234.1 homocysteine S-methyltransferase family protein [Bombella pluederhausensis]